MLTPQGAARCDAGFRVYDHDWRFFSEFLGEPFLVGDLLAYFDGRIFYLCAFPIGDEAAAPDSLEHLVELGRNNFPHWEKVRGIDVWGTFSVEPDLSHQKAVVGHRLVEHSESTASDAVLDLTTFSFETQRPARKYRNAARNKGVVSRVVEKTTSLSWEHLRILDLFLSSHSVSLTHASFYLALPNILRLPHIRMVEGRREGELLGFSVVSRPNSRSASILMGFYDNSKSSHVADGVTAAAIEWALESGIERLHFGYSGTDSLLKFKSKWGPLEFRSSYSEAFLSNDPSIASLFRRGCFPWRERMFTELLARLEATNVYRNP